MDCNYELLQKMTRNHESLLGSTSLPETKKFGGNTVDVALPTTPQKQEASYYLGAKPTFTRSLECYEIESENKGTHIILVLHFSEFETKGNLTDQMIFIHLIQAQYSYSTTLVLQFL